MSYRPDPTYPRLNLPLGDAVCPAHFPRHTPRYRDTALATALGLGDLDEAGWERHFARFAPLPDNLTEPVALRYHGHQFRHYNPQLGDGRGFLFAQLRDERGRLLDLGTKGSGETPWSRGGDGRLTLRGGVREVLAAELLTAHGVDSWRPLALYETGESLVRHDEPSPTRASVLVRVSHGSWRFGTAQRLAYLGEREALRRLVEHVLAEYMPQLEVRGDPAVALLSEVCARSARLVARWMSCGFVHGVLNTDNMSLSGQSFDYGPYRFIPSGDPGFVAAYFDDAGLYRFGRQPEAVLWNLRRLADALSEIAPKDELHAALLSYGETFRAATRAVMCERLGLRDAPGEAGRRLVEAVSALLSWRPVGWERLFFDWYGGDASRALGSPESAFYAGPLVDRLRAALEDVEPAHPERLAHPYFQGEGPCTLLWEEIEAIWTLILARDDWSGFEHKLAHIRQLGAALTLTDS